MKIPFAKIFRRYTKTIPEVVFRQLKESFPNAKNIDWEYKDHHYEAVFYLNDSEYIAQISEKGILLESKKNLWPDQLPDNIKSESNCTGEIMNVILITRGDEQLYEVIIRDERLDRFLFVYNITGDLIDSRPLQ
jgi:hypothetical protein